MTQQTVFQQIKETLQEVYGDRLRGVILYGSEARGETREDSDLDLLVLLNGPIQLGDDLRTIIHALYPIQLQIFRPIHAFPADAASFEKGEFALYRNAKREGIHL